MSTPASLGYPLIWELAAFRNSFMIALSASFKPEEIELENTGGIKKS
jgi:hypothetical protein